MFKKSLMAWWPAAAVVAAAVMPAAAQADALIGKDGWLFTPYEYAVSSDAADTQASIDLFIEANKLFAAKGIALGLVIVPSKIRMVPEKLPDDKPLDAYTSGKYAKAVAALRAGGVSVISLEAAFMASPDRLSDTPLYLRLDTHWSPKGAALAAQTIQQAVVADPKLAAAYGQTQPVKFELSWGANKVSTRARDLARQIPRGGPVFAPEQILPLKLSKIDAGAATLTGAGEAVDILLIGSSYTSKNTSYPDAVRYALQRELLDLSLNVDYGPWYGMLSYLKGESYKTRPPKLIIWEIPERELRSPPNYKYRHPEYVLDNQSWLSQMRSLLK